MTSLINDTDRDKIRAAVRRVTDNKLILRQTTLTGSNARNSLYHVLTTPTSVSDWGTSDEELAAVGLILVHHDVSVTRGPQAVYHHIPTGSSVKITSGWERPHVHIYGQNRNEARPYLENLAKSKGLELEQLTPEEARWQM